MTEVVFIVDDNKVNRKLLAVILKKEGYALLEAEDGAEALEVAFREVPDLILLDIMMPKKDGYEVCTTLKADQRTAHIPIIFLSAMSQTEDKIKGLDLGAADYVIKPFDRGEVIARVRARLKISRLNRELLAANAELIHKQEKLDEDLKAAAGIQRNLLPKSIPHMGPLDVAWRFMPCERIGGDIFNVVRLDEKQWGIYMLDVSGHGVPSALVAVSVSQMLHAEHDRILKQKHDDPPYYEIVSPSRVLEILDREYPIERFDKYFTMSYVIIDTDAKRITYSNAAHPPPVLRHKDGGLEFLSEGGTIIGMGGMLPFEEGSIEMRQGDRLFLYTDGILEYQNSEGELYGENRFFAQISMSKHRSIKDHTDGIINGIMNFGDHLPPQDDVTLLGIEFKNHIE
jgi:sigma-B regulation protein RsbU (phosphoserine phosphatase)